MSRKGFTLIELLAVIVIIGIASVLIVGKVEKNVKNAKKIKEQELKSTIENAAYLYANSYSSNLSNINTINVDSVSISELINVGLLNEEDISNINVSNTVLIAKINNEIKTKYNIDNLNQNIIFLIGLEEVSVGRGILYIDSGAFVAKPGEGIIELTTLNMSSNVNTSITGSYEVTYSYQNAANVTRKVNVVESSSNEYKVLFILKLNGGSTSQTFENSYLPGSTISLVPPTKRGYEFVDWNIKGGTINNNILNIGSNSITLTANWRAIQDYNINYILNGGIITGTNPSTYNKNTPSITLINPTKEGYTFIGWTGSNGTVPQTTVTIPTNSTGSKIYTANWQTN